MSTQVKRGREKSRSIETSPPSRHSHQSRHYLREPAFVGRLIFRVVTKCVKVPNSKTECF